MLRITQQSSAAAAKKYYSAADYYTQGQEIVGLWGGVGAKRLGLAGVVDRESFELLCDNRNPETNGPLTVRSKQERTVGYDFTWSVPKSVSLVYAMTGDRDILDAFRASVHETMCEMEREMKTRVRRGGRYEDRLSGEMTWAEFIHTTSRPVEGEPDPQLHAHCFAFNATWDDEERRHKAGQFRDLKRDAPYFQAAFRVRLANRLQDLGFAIERKRDDFEIAGISGATLKKFSRRTEKIDEAYVEKLAKRLVKLKHGVLSDGHLEVNGKRQSPQQILAAAEQYGIVFAEDKAKLGEETRERKGEELPWPELQPS